LRDRLTLLTVSSFVVFLLSTSTWQSMNFVDANPMLPLPVIRIMSDGRLDPATVYPPTAPINITGNVYTLTRNITDYRLEILCSNITIDGAGYTIQGKLQYSGAGISIGANGVTIKNFDIGYYDPAGINITGSSNAITGNNINGGILLEGDHNNITKNVINATVEIMGDFNNLTGNIVSSYIYCIRGNNNSITANTISGGGIVLRGSVFFNTISENNITGCNKGIELDDSSYNVIFKNDITNCEYSVWLAGLSTLRPDLEDSTKNNTFYHNNFVNNTFDVGTSDENFLELSEATRNFWDNGKEGNYWSNYTGTDNDGNGIGDTPYIIDAKRQDNYPLMLPFNIQNNTLQMPISSPTPSISPTSSASQQPTQSSEPQQTTFPTELVYTLAAVAVIAAVAGIAFILRKRK